MARVGCAQPVAGSRINGDRILLAQPVMLSGKREGTLYLLADLHAMTSQLLKLYGGIFALVLVASLLVGTLNNALVVIGFGAPEQIMVQGIIIVAAVIVSSRGGRRARWRWLLRLEEADHRAQDQRAQQ